MNRLIIGIVGIAALAVVIGTQVLAALGKAQPEGLQHTADLCLGGLIGIATSEGAKVFDAKKSEETT